MNDPVRPNGLPAVIAAFVPALTAGATLFATTVRPPRLSDPPSSSATVTDTANGVAGELSA